ncbi:MAG: bifunctional RNase H/acid phosphatase [Actinobacteria bacterium]|nr:bifunctional RNase H/acid phosphatase [Actinomycetota bacterium]
MRHFIIEADGASRGNPGQASYGAVVRDAETAEVLAEIAEPIGIATNNVAEYRGLIAGLERARVLDATARVTARLDSKLVVEQMSGRWQIKHPDMRELAKRARDVLPYDQVTYQWVERALNSAADSLANEALDQSTYIDRVPGMLDGGLGVVPPDPRPPLRGPGRPGIPGWTFTGEPTTTYLIRHGVTAHTVAKRFSGYGGADLPLVDLGVDQATAAGQELARRGGVDLVVCSPLKRTQQTAQKIADANAISSEQIVVVEGLRETAFGDWDGLTWEEVLAGWPTHVQRWLGDPTIAPPEGESYTDTVARVGEVMRDLLHEHAGKRIAIVSHVTPIKGLVLHALGAPLDAIYRMQLLPASITTVAWFSDGNTSMSGYAEAAHLSHLT